MLWLHLPSFYGFGALVHMGLAHTRTREAESSRGKSFPRQRNDMCVCVLSILHVIDICWTQLSILRELEHWSCGVVLIMCANDNHQDTKRRDESKENVQKCAIKQFETKLITEREKYRQNLTWTTPARITRTWSCISQFTSYQCRYQPMLSSPECPKSSAKRTTVQLLPQSHEHSPMLQHPK